MNRSGWSWKPYLTKELVDDNVISPEQAERIRQQWMEQFTGPPERDPVVTATKGGTDMSANAKGIVGWAMIGLLFGGFIVGGLYMIVASEGVVVALAAVGATGTLVAWMYVALRLIEGSL